MTHNYSKKDIENRFNSNIGKTLGEIDTSGDFKRTNNNPKITGIAGDIVEHSILGYSSDTRQDADITIDGNKVEVKTTGIRGTYNKPETYRAKERITITNVSPERIKNEDFTNSSLWKKLENTLIAYYLYDSDSSVSASQYSKFPFLGYQLHTFSPADKKVIMEDWKIIKDFCVNVGTITKSDEEAAAYSKAKKGMMYLETAPGWKNRPRFALKKSFVNEIINEHFGKVYESTQEEISSYNQLDKFLAKSSKKYKNLSIEEISRLINIDVSSKSIAHNLITHILNPDINETKGEDSIDIVAKSGLDVKTVTILSNGKKKENCKFSTIDFDEFYDINVQRNVRNSDIYDYFSNTHFLFAIFKDMGESGQKDDIFLGFKHLLIPEEYLENHLVPVLNDIKDKIINNTFEVYPKLRKNGTAIFNKTGVQQMTNNFPKSSEGAFFVNGTSSNSTYKPLNINNYRLYNQQIWLRGDSLLSLLDSINYL